MVEEEPPAPAARGELGLSAAFWAARRRTACEFRDARAARLGWAPEAFASDYMCGVVRYGEGDRESFCDGGGVEMIKRVVRGRRDVSNHSVSMCSTIARGVDARVWQWRVASMSMSMIAGRSKERD